MPIPIRYVPDLQREDKNYGIDYSFLATQPSPKKTVTASNKDAALLFELWSKCERGENPDDIKISSTVPVDARDLLRLKTMGFLVGVGDDLCFTRKGKMVITTMALGEESQFDKRATQKSYTEILASMNKRGKKGFRIAGSDPQFATNNTNRLDLRDK